MRNWRLSFNRPSVMTIPPLPVLSPLPYLECLVQDLRLFDGTTLIHQGIIFVTHSPFVGITMSRLTIKMHAIHDLTKDKMLFSFKFKYMLCFIKLYNNTVPVNDVKYM